MYESIKKLDFISNYQRYSQTFANTIFTLHQQKYLFLNTKYLLGLNKSQMFDKL